MGLLPYPYLSDHVTIKTAQFLATIKRDVPLDVTLDTIEYDDPEYEALLEYVHFYEPEYNPMMRRLFR